MQRIDLDAANSIHLEHHLATPGRPTFVFLNALSGDCAMWRPAIAPALGADGAGTVLWNYRGQTDSPIDGATEITAAQISADATRVLETVRPACPILVGLSIGGLFAINAHLALACSGAGAAGLVLLNTLRRDGPRLRWINDAVYRAVITGGPALLRDLFSPLLFAEPWLEANRASFLQDAPYEPMPATDAAARMLAAGATADWNVPYERLTMPVAVVSGLQDHVFFDAADVARLAARMPAAERVDLADAGHMLPVEAPEAVIAACRSVARRIA